MFIFFILCMYIISMYGEDNYLSLAKPDPCYVKNVNKICLNHATTNTLGVAAPSASQYCQIML